MASRQSNLMYKVDFKSQTAICLVLIFSIYIIILMANSLFLPDNFNFDARTIQLLISGKSNEHQGVFDGFQNTASIYRAFGAETIFPEWLVILILNIIYWIAAINVLGKLNLNRQNLFKNLISMGWILCSSLFLSRYSKELLSLVPTFIICFARMETRLKRSLVLLIVLEYVFFIRMYWTLILAFYFAFHFLLFRVKAAIPIKLIAMATIYFLPFWMVSALGLQYLTDWRVFANLNSNDSHRAKSALVNLLTNTGSFTDYANALYAWLYLNLPIKLFFDEAFRYKAFALFQFGSVVILIATTYAEYKYHHERLLTDDPFYTRCLSFILAYSFTQAIFEPDVGSFFRHQIILTVPLIYLLYPKQKQTMLLA